MRQFDPLPNNAIVYRTLLRKQWIDEDTGKVKADAYFLRVNERGLSVNLASVCSPKQCAELFHKCYGVASIEVAGVREIGLDVEQDWANHANIINLPYRENDLAEAERLAGLLARQSQIVWKPE
ncbi:hypothetical protein MEN41_06390 [Dolichospermum sp. ST_con]|nr:hypothetical protein [Dolichospermum sp. ST_con]MDD1420999.1 hypothetical protein [Dolichospermum sp. ST_sed1]MDD1426106.1 hypothetical protein [Dolichospermum sp. ST_sed9]MDD1432602.1 hypothetical protein [Dolichospermum sp. ST_sed6]MDD1438028.1 hypothetical protein [Dolichospermum sp. ST_sed10]MDD1441955.1 hypothetical protein [Dolichospermum sp. ST_sed3]MDD1447707.1 hypothetical protein [Dolichospermum sp. ST_sed8]MDD1453580.1 hypothetical protein [Dolichospermum sp. ST_sed7]MDD146143